MIIGLDLDGVCVNFQGGWVAAYNQWFDKNINASDAKDWDSLVTLTHFDSERAFFHWADVTHPTFWADLPVVPGFQAGVTALSGAGNRLLLITNRSTLAQAGTEAWLRRHWPLGIAIPQLHFAAGSKAVVPAQVYVDDSPTVISDLMGQSKQVIKFKRPWNRDAVSTTTVSDWVELTKMLLTMGEAIAA